MERCSSKCASAQSAQVEKSAGHTLCRAIVIAGLIAPALLTGSTVFTQRGGAPSQATPAAQRETYDYWGVQRDMIRRGQQAIFMCNGLFTSNRTLDQVYAQELKFLPEPIGTPAGGDYVVDRAKKAVAFGAPGAAPVMRAAYRLSMRDPRLGVSRVQEWGLR